MPSTAPSILLIFHSKRRLKCISKGWFDTIVTISTLFLACPIDWASFPGAVGNVQLQIVEMTGVPGDVWLVDLRVLHVGSPNVTERPRMMLTFRYERSDLLREVADAFGWS